MHLSDLPRKRPIGPSLGTRGQDGRNVEYLRERGMCENVVPELVWCEVPNELEQTHLVINNKESSVVLPEPRKDLAVRYMLSV